MKYCKRNGKASIKPLADGARDDMELWIANNKTRIEEWYKQLGIDVPEEIVFETQ